MDHFALAFLEWLGRVVAQRLAGTALSAAWKRLSIQMQLLSKSSNENEETALESEGKAHAVIQDAKQSLALLKAANEKIKLLETETEKLKLLEAENAELRARLAKYEPPDQPS